LDISSSADQPSGLSGCQGGIRYPFESALLRRNRSGLDEVEFKTNAINGIHTHSKVCSLKNRSGLMICMTIFKGHWLSSRTEEKYRQPTFGSLIGRTSNRCEAILKNAAPA
jgi:hypothetical protein